jgi:putative intracellular protease/amidase
MVCRRYSKYGSLRLLKLFFRRRPQPSQSSKDIHFESAPGDAPSGIRLNERRLTMKILMVLTSHNVLGNTGKPTGFWLEEFTAPYYVFTDAGAEVTEASVKGGQPSIDPKSDAPGNQTDSMERIKKNPAARKDLANTVKLSEVTSDGYDTVFYPGGHGPLWDLVEDKKSIALIEEFYNAGNGSPPSVTSPLLLNTSPIRGSPSSRESATRALPIVKRKPYNSLI